MCLVLPATATLQGLLALFLCTHREEGEAAAGTSSCVAICVYAPFFPLSYHFSFYNIYKRNWERERERKGLEEKYSRAYEYHCQYQSSFTRALLRYSGLLLPPPPLAVLLLPERTQVAWIGTPVSLPVYARCVGGR